MKRIQSTLRMRSLLACGPFVIAGLLASGGVSDAKAIDAAACGEKTVVNVNLIDFDPAVGDVHARLHLCLPPSKISKEQAPKRDTVMVDTETVDESILEISSKKPFSNYDTFINAKYQVDDPGSQFMYPFDEHTTYIHFFVTERNAGLARIPISFDCTSCFFDGFQVNITDAGTTATDVRKNIRIRRTMPIKVFSVFLAIAMWTMTVVVLVLAIRVSRQTRSAPEITTMAFIGGLLFAFPAIRGAQPNVPPMGVLSDYLAFFWDEFILVVALVVVMIAWLRYPREAK
ncbi:MAG: DUF4436 domain-containing protein [Candidatus Eremiobacteraeota bacterium]|nr:DUF4436 domain-containing protein [Candidatus Eremiobacteraeota bacterium]